MPRGADIVAKSLADHGVSCIFTVSGNHVMPVFDALLSTDIKLIHARHEAACVHMADAWGRLTGKPGIALVTGGQGHSNAVAALYTALAAESPVVLLSGHAGLHELGQGAFQEMLQADLARPVAKASWTAATTVGLGDDITKALKLALSGRPGPVHVSLPVDLLDATISDAELKTPTVPSTHEAAPAATIATIRSHVAAASRPLMICGPQMCNERGHALMSRVSNATGVPVLGMESPRGVNDPGLGSFAEILGDADLIVLIGKPLDFTLKFGGAPIASACKWIVVDPDKALIARARAVLKDRLLLAENADAEAMLKRLTASQLDVSPHQAWRKNVEAAISYRPASWRSVKSEADGHLHPVEMCRVISDFVEKQPNAVFVGDGGEIGQWAQALVNADRRVVNGVAGTIGAALPFAIAAKVAYPDAPVIAVMGDGTFGFHMAEFDTAVRYNLPIIAVVGNDARWNAEYQIQLRNYGEARAKHCELLPSRYDLVVEALGGFGALVRHVDELPAAIERARQSGKPACINVMIEGVPAPVVRR
ncbi:MAG: thiamine pyrophosphate-binding protein [Xanthobacteraceae bacterium]|nr:thiamine pyrophosphate-binding protein [Xanthobacteraceae bacterium]